MSVQYRLATLADGPALEALIRLSTLTLQSAYYSPVQLEGALGTVFGVDSQLIKDGTYFVANERDVIIGCGGWSKRKTLYGGDAKRSGEDPLRDPETEPAMIRAFFVHPGHVRRGIARQLLQQCEAAATRAGFGRLEIIATLAGERLYAACGYDVVERFDIELGNGARLPVVRMRRRDLPVQEPLHRAPHPTMS
ncbi:GNAT family N-acetyltransferase [Prosthecobacter sp. SYSU 5D2]|uniref:GNAT family N-acetyltransferase n=1 Tax=Prosthecobacter sp. SYSU 5D2 TaxID=3134134 RepID=UPI0031FE705E